MSALDGVAECTNNAPSPEHEDGILCCSLDEGHAGPHHDTFDRVLWEVDADSGELRYWPDREARQ